MAGRMSVRMIAVMALSLLANLIPVVAHAHEAPPGPTGSDRYQPYESVTSAELGPVPGLAGIVSITPGRILDTRDGTGAPAAPVGEDASIDLAVLGLFGVPAGGVDTVVVNVTVTQPTAPSSFVTVWPTGAEMPEASSLNMTAGQTIANLVVAKVGAGGRISLYNRFGSTHLIADVVGYSTATEHLHPLVPARVLDTRSGNGAPAVKVGENASIDVVMAGRGGVPAVGAGSVVVNVTVADPSAESYVTVWPTGATQPEASNLNMAQGETRANLVIAKLGTDGKISLFNRFGATHLIADVVGWMPLRGAYTPINPTRILDTRNDIGLYGTPVFSPAIGANILRPGSFDGPLGAGKNFSVGLDQEVGVPHEATALVINITAVGATQSTYITAWPSGSPMPTASVINVEPGDVAPNLVVVERGGADQWYNGTEFFNLYNAFGRVHLLADLVGYYMPRSTQDAPDDQDDTIHVVVAAPSDVAFSIDEAGALFTTTVAEQWLRDRTGRGLRLDTFGGVPEVSTVRFRRTRQELEADVGPRDAALVFAEIAAAGFASEGKRYLVYVHGISTGSLLGIANYGGPTAIVFGSAASVNAGVTWTSSLAPEVALHELFHSFGAVSACAPHSDGSDHVTDPHDLMYPTASDPSLTTLDAGHDDYWGQGASTCDGEPVADLSLSPFLD